MQFNPCGLCVVAGLLARVPSSAYATSTIWPVACCTAWHSSLTCERSCSFAGVTVEKQKKLAGYIVKHTRLFE